MCDDKEESHTLPVQRESSGETFSRKQFNAAPKKLLRNGRAANAVVWRLDWNGKRWTVKDFSSRSWIVRNTIGAFLIGRELAVLGRLRGIDGIAQHFFRIDRFALAVEFVEGRSLNDVPDGEVSAQYLRALERLTAKMHARGIAHLDLRGKGNVLVRNDGKPAIIDFQSALNIDWMPRWLSSPLRAMDLSGALKKWHDCQPGKMTAAQKEGLRKVNSWRKFWIFHGYFGLSKHGKKSRK